MLLQVKNAHYRIHLHSPGMLSFFEGWILSYKQHGHKYCDRLIEMFLLKDFKKWAKIMRSDKFASLS